MNGQVILQGVVGSTAYGLATPTSDIDELGIFQAPLGDVLGIHGASVIKNSVTTNDPDLTLHEVGKYVSLVVKGNPTALELLFLDNYTRTTDRGRLLIQNRDVFLGHKEVLTAYVGYVKSQAKRLLNRAAEGNPTFNSDLGKRTHKHARHSIRLLLQAEELITTGTITIDVSKHRDYIYEVGQWALDDPATFAAMVEGFTKRLTSLETVLPPTVDTKKASELLVEIRLSERTS